MLRYANANATTAKRYTMKSSTNILRVGAFSRLWNQSSQ